MDAAQTLLNVREPTSSCSVEGIQTNQMLLHVTVRVALACNTFSIPVHKLMP